MSSTQINETVPLNELLHKAGSGRKKSDHERHFVVFVCALLVAAETLVYGWVWYHFYVGQYFLRVRYWNRGNWAYIGMFAVYLVIFGLIFKCFSIAYTSTGELILSHLVMVIVVHAIAFVQLCFIVQKYWLRWHPLMISLVVDLLISILWCIVCTGLYKSLFPPRNALLISSGSSEEIADQSLFRDRTATQYLVRGTMSPEKGLEAISDVIGSGKYQTIIVNEIEEKLRNQIIKLCYEKELPCYVVPSIYDILLLGSERITYFDTPLQFFRNNRDLPVDESILKRLCDIILSVILLVLTSPVFLITMLLVLLDTGKVFAKHEMLTKNGRTFNLIRFQVRNTDYAPAWKSSDYLRQYSPIGRTINRLHIAGLPQLFNVIKGDISLVGPRPYTMKLTARYYDMLVPEVLYRLRVKGGLLGNAQLNAKKGSSPMDVLNMDIDYIENFSIRKDVLIILRSIVPHSSLQ